MHRKLRLGVLLLALFSIPGQVETQTALGEVMLQLPDRDWGLRVHPTGFEFDPPMTVRSGRAVWAGGDSVQTGLMVEVVLEHAPQAKGVSDCVLRFEPRLRLDASSVTGLKRYRSSQGPVIEYDILEHRGTEIKQRNLHGYRYHDAACSEIHVSFVGFEGGASTALQRVLRSIDIVKDLPQ